MSLAKITPCRGSTDAMSWLHGHWLRLGAVLALASCAAAALVLVALLQSVSARQQGWNEHLRLQFGDRGLAREVAMPVLLRLATHPLAAGSVDGRRVGTRHDTWSLAAQGDGRLRAVCAPCRVDLPALGPTPVDIERIELHLQALGADHYRARLTFGAETHAFSLALRGRIDASGRLVFEASMPTTPLADVVAVLGRDLPERSRLQVDGKLALALRGTWPGADWQARVQIADVAVSGMRPDPWIVRPTACRDSSDATWPTFGGWLPRAVVTVLDPGYFEHAGYRIDAWTARRAKPKPTLSQRAARLALGTDDAAAAPTLRETLYAVELERTLGKAGLLDFYLAQVPWGEGLCGAERAVRVHLGQRDANAVGPVAAAWLASLLPAPDERLHAEKSVGQVDRDRVAGVIHALRPMHEARREKALADLLTWAPAALPTVAPPASAPEIPAPTPAPPPPPLP